MHSVVSVKFQLNRAGYLVDASRQIGGNAFEGYYWINKTYFRIHSDFVTRLVSTTVESPLG